MLRAKYAEKAPARLESIRREFAELGIEVEGEVAAVPGACFPLTADRQAGGMVEALVRALGAEGSVLPERTMKEGLVRVAEAPAMPGWHPFEQARSARLLAPKAREFLRALESGDTG